MDAVGPATTLDPEALRRDFPILSQPGGSSDPSRPLAYLDSASTSQCPRPVLRTMIDVYERHYGNVHRATHRLARQTTELFEAARAKIRDLIGAAEACEVIFTSGTTHAITLDRLLSPRTRLVAFAAVSNVLGTINPIAEITRRAHQAGAMVLVDAAQAVPRMPVDVRELDVDFLAFGGHKMLAPTGVGVLYGCRALLERMPPVWSGGSMMRHVTLEGFEPAGLPGRFEAGTPPIVQAIARGAAVDYLRAVGLEQLADHEHRLTTRAHEILPAIPGLRIWGPGPDQKSGIVAFTVDGFEGRAVAEYLDSQGIFVRAGHHCAIPLHTRLGISSTVRASFYVYNTMAEVARLAEALGQMVRDHRPAVGLRNAGKGSC